DQDLDDASRPASCFRRRQEALKEPGRLVNGGSGPLLRLPRQEHPGQRDVLEFVEVTEVIGGGQALLAGPAERLTEPALRHPDACPQRRDRLYVREEIAGVQALRL